MSLLMDALKKAEKEKKEAAKKNTGQGPVLDTGEYSNVPEGTGEFSNTDSHEIPVNLDTSEIPMQLEPLGNTLEQQLDLTSESTQLPVENTAEHQIQEAKLEQEPGFEDTSTSEIGFENTEEFKSASAEELSKDTLFEDTDEAPTENTLEEQRLLSGRQNDEIPFAETLESVTASQLLDDIGQFEGQPTPVAASTVFAATKSSNVVSKFKLGLITVMVLVVVVVTSLLVHYKTTPDVPNVPSPMVAKGVEATRPTVLPDMTASITTDSSTGSSDIQHPQEAEVVETVYVQHTGALASPSIEDWGPLYNEQELATRRAKEEERQALATEVVSRSEPSIPEPPQVEEQLALAETGTMDEVVMAPVAASISPSMIKISRIKKPKPEVAINQQAYNAYQQGNYDAAASLYKTSLGKTANNRDALLGLAAIKMRHNQPEAAYSLYQKVLKQNPKDTTAKVALISLQGNRNTANNESLLKLLLKDHPESASTFFSLGNLYARQLRWPEAQLAFFEAYSRESNNADYAMNLAVSLDQMGQSKAALDYYNKAMDLVDTQSANFNPSSILARIKVLSGSDS